MRFSISIIGSFALVLASLLDVAVAQSFDRDLHPDILLQQRFAASAMVNATHIFEFRGTINERSSPALFSPYEAIAEAKSVSGQFLIDASEWVHDRGDGYGGNIGAGVRNALTPQGGQVFIIDAQIVFDDFVFSSWVFSIPRSQGVQFQTRSFPRGDNVVLVIETVEHPVRQPRHKFAISVQLGPGDMYPDVPFSEVLESSIAWSASDPQGRIPRMIFNYANADTLPPLRTIAVEVALTEFRLAPVD